MRGRLLFMLTLWMAISVALLSALTPLGPPSSIATGSAFNPATTGVVLKARTQSAPADYRLTQPDGSGDSPLLSSLMPWLVSVAGLLTVAGWSRSKTLYVRTRPSRWRGRITHSFHARAPPVLT